MPWLSFKKMAAYLTAIIFFVTADRLFKVLALNHFFLPPIDLLNQVFRLNYSQNYYLAFSLPLTGWLINGSIIFIILIFVHYFVYWQLKVEYNKAGWTLFIIFGAISNLADRLNYGFVIDYFDLKYFTVFNLADIMIVGGVIGLVLNYKICHNMKTF